MNIMNMLSMQIVMVMRNSLLYYLTCFFRIQNGKSIEDVRDESPISFAVFDRECEENLSSVIKSLKTEVYYHTLFKSSSNVIPLFFYDRGFVIHEDWVVLMCYFYMIFLGNKVYLIPACTEVHFEAEGEWTCIEHAALRGVTGSVMKEVFEKLKLSKWFEFNNELKCYELKTSVSTFLKKL